MAAPGFVFEHDAGIDVILGPNIAGVYGAASHAIPLFLKLSLAFDAVFNLGINGEIEAVFESFKRANEQVARDQQNLCN